MFEQLNISKEKFNNIEIPNELDDIIEKAVGRGHRKRFFRGRGFRVTTAAVVVMAILIISINLSPSFAKTLNGIPLLSSIVDIFNYDKGIEGLYSNSHIPQINKSASDNGIKFTINYAVMDEKRLIMAYTIDGEEKYKDIYLGHIDVQTGNNKSFQIANKKYIGRFKDGKAAGVLEVMNLNQSNIKDGMENIKVICSNMYDENNGPQYIEGNWTIEFNLDKSISKLEPMIYNLEYISKVDDYEIKVNSIKVYPSITEAEIEVSGENVINFRGFKNLRLEDGNGTKYRVLSVKNILSDTKQTFKIDFESSYFSKNSELYLVTDGVYLDEHTKKNVVLSLKEGKIVDNAGYDIEYKEDKDRVYDFRREDGKPVNINMKEIALSIRDSEVVKDFNDIDTDLIDIRYPNVYGAIYGVSAFDRTTNIRYDAPMRIKNITKDSVDIEFYITDLTKDNIAPDILQIEFYLLKPIDTKMNIKIN